MKIILLQPTDKVGKKYDIKEVADGYARNFLFVRNLAVIYSKENYQKLLLRKKNEEKTITKNIDTINWLTMETLVLKFKAKANPLGKLFAQVTKKMIVDKIFKEFKIKLKPDNLICEQHLKELGEYQLGLKPNFLNKIKVIVEKL